jgi:transposase
MSTCISVDLRRAAVSAYEENKTGSYEETAAIFGIGRSTLGKLLKRKRETGDVLPKSKGGNNPRRVNLDWLRQHAQDFPDARLVFIDESGYRLGATTRYGWSPRGDDAFGKEPGGWETMTMIGAIALDGFRGFTAINAATSSEVFEAFVNQELVPNLRAGDIVCAWTTYAGYSPHST